MLSATDLTFAYGQRLLLKDAALRLNKGEIGILSGPNGVGKTTLLKILARLLTPTKGKVEAGGPVSIDLGESFFYPELSLRENWEFYARLYSSPVDWKNRLYRCWKMDGFMDRPFAVLSKGEKRKGGIIRALLKPADVYLLDEPYVGLDKESGPVFSRFAEELKAEGKTFLIAAHEETGITAIDRRFSIDDRTLAEGVA